MQNKLTVKEALEQGYKLWGYKEQEYGSLGNISEITEEDFRLATDGIVVVRKEPDYLSVDGDDIWDLVQDNIMGNSDFHDDTDTIPDALKEKIDWNGFADKINAVLKDHPYYYLTNIQLIP